MLLLSTALGACATLEPPPSDTAPPQSSDALSFWDKAVNASPSKRSEMLTAAEQAKAEWAIAMLRSLAWEGGDASESSARLRAVLNKGLYADQATLVRLRLREMQGDQACRMQIEMWRARASQIVEIEQDIQNGRKTDNGSDTGR